MSDHINRRIASLREALAKGIFLESLDFLTRECHSLEQDTNYCLAFFVLKNIFRELSSALESGPIQLGEHAELTSRIATACDSIPGKIDKGESIEAEELDSVIRQHIRNISIFRSEH
jgi:hypothetical protein